MPDAVKGFLKVHKDVVLEILFAKNSKVEDLFNCTASCPEAGLLFSNDFFCLGFQSIKQHHLKDFTGIGNKTDCPVVLTLMEIPLLGQGNDK